MIHYWSLISALVKVHVTEFCFKRDRVTEFCFLTHRYRVTELNVNFVSPMTSSLTCLLWRCFASNLSFPSLFFSPQLCRQSDNPEHSIKGPLIDTRSVQETQHAYKSILLFSHWRAGPVLPGIHYLTYQLHHFNKGHFSLPSPCPLDLRSKSKFFLLLLLLLLIQEKVITTRIDIDKVGHCKSHREKGTGKGDCIWKERTAHRNDGNLALFAIMVLPPKGL